MKVEYALSKGLSGVMVWSIETDDFSGVCSSTKYPLLRLINEVAGRVISESNMTTTTTQRSTSNTTSSPVTEMPTSAITLTSTSTTNPSTSPGSVCKIPGYFRNENDCNKFYQCVLNSDKITYRVYYYSCPSGLFFDTYSIVCNYPHLVDCN